MRAERMRARPGSALLDVMLSLALLATAGVALVTLLGQTAHTLDAVRRTEGELRGASDELGRLATYDRATLLSLLGRTQTRGWTLTVAQRSADLFDVAIAATDSTPPLLTTTVFRPDTADARVP